MANAPILDLDWTPVGSFQVNCYLLADKDTKEAVLVDPGDEASRLLAWVEEKGYALKAIWLTHAHVDHIQAVAAIRDRAGVKVSLHPGDWPLAEQLATQAMMLGLAPGGKALTPDVKLADGMELTVGKIRATVWHTPGHSPGSCCLLLPARGEQPGRLITGDTLFAGSIGRTDLPGGSMEKIGASLERILTLPDDTRVHPGHGPDTTVGVERRMNPFLR